MNVQAENKIAARGILHFIYNFVVTRMIGDELILPAGKRVSTGCGYAKVFVSRQALPPFYANA